MSAVIRSLRIESTADRIWTVLADFESIDTWAPNVDHSCLLSEVTSGIGMQRRIQSGRTTIVETVTSWEPGVSLGYSITGLPPVLGSVSNLWRLDRDGDGTRVTLTSLVEAVARPPQRVIARMVGRRLAQASDQMLAGLAGHVTRKEPSP